MHNAIRRKFGMRQRSDNNPWNSPRGTRNTLAEFLGENKFNKGAEIGVRAGAYSSVLLKANLNLHLYCIDPWTAYGRLDQESQDSYYQEAVKNLAGQNATFIRSTSMDALVMFEDYELDFVYIDGNHEFDHACSDIIFWSQKVRSGGIVAVHDYYQFQWAGVTKAVDAYTHCHNISPWYVTREKEPTAFWVKP